ncbi:HD-GYP domain-containing protein [Paenibacillus sp. Soil522]|uniref:HD-GYP domain-containing protein n=1 Tax=Paenibacillus sp. Soil522 TaxID=1736388 RepID=UPI0006FECE14|nr:HD domain-containing protein [Paenibacillus sp. Soil522]KRE46276.1 HD family phosphohydrolase [Paenibacillus sp. Soil522]
MRVHVSDLINGDRLSHDTFNDFGLHVLSKGTIVYSQEISRLFQHRIDYIDIDERVNEETKARTLESTVNPKWLPTVQPVYKNAVKNIEGLFTKALQGEVDEEEVTSMIQPLLNNLQMERDVVSMLLLLNTNDDYTYQHSVQVGMLSYYLATWVGYSNEEAVHIGKAGFLHDIGKCRIQANVLNKPGKLTDDEIHPIAKIISVVDIYSAMISERVYQQKRDLLFVLKELYRLSFKELDPFTTQTFIKHMIPNFIGKRVELLSGETGIIIMTHPTEFFRPLIQIDAQFIDMSNERDYEIRHVYL